MSLNSIFTSLNLIAERFIRKQCQLPTIFPLEEDCINQKDPFTLIVEIGRFDPCIMLVVIDSCLFVCVFAAMGICLGILFLHDRIHMSLSSLLTLIDRVSSHDKYF